MIAHPNYQIQTTESIQEPISFSEVTGSISPFSELAKEPEISKPDTEPAVTPTSGFASPTSNNPGSPRVRNIITQNLPSGVISIEELVNPEEDVILLENQQILNLREHESIFYSPFRSDAWYVSLIIFLENPGLSFSPPQTPFHPTPRGYYPSSIMSRQSSMFTQTPKTFLFGGLSIPSGYQSLSGTFSGASPRPLEQVLSSGSNGTQVLNVEQILMMSGSIPNPQPQGSQLPPGGQPQGNQLPPGEQPQGS